MASITIKQSTTKDTVGEARDYAKEPTKLEIPNLKVTMNEVDSDGFFAWHEDFVIKGNNSDDKEKTGSIVFLDPTRKQALLTIDLRNLGIFRAAKTNNADKIATVTAEMYCENIQAKFSRVAPPVDADAGR